MSESNLSGSLWLVATPIGNLSDFSPRGKEVLSRVDQVACEDTRVTKKLLNSLSLEVPLISYREENERKKSIELADLIEGGKKIALLSDAGYPAISDPGFRLVRECRKRGLSVNPIPGANAALTALACSGLPTHQFLYLGFLPKKSVGAEKLLKKWENFEGSIVLYESKYRIEKTLTSISNVLGGDRLVCLCKEITKIHESFNLGPVSTLLEKVNTLNNRGEFTIVIAPAGYHL